VLLRICIVAACAGVIALLGLSLHDSTACRHAQTNLFGAVIGRLPARLEAPALRDIPATCRGTAGLVVASAALERQRRLRESLAFAYRATREEPQSATGWNAFAVVAAAAHRPALARRAAGEAQRLSPLGQVPPVSQPGRRPAADGGP
jgi:hypothetical protein